MTIKKTAAAPVKPAAKPAVKSVAKPRKHRQALGAARKGGRQAAPTKPQPRPSPSNRTPRLQPRRPKN